MLACEAENILLAAAGSDGLRDEQDDWQPMGWAGETRGQLRLRQAAWMEMLISSAGWERSVDVGNVISWNMGPCGLEQAKAEIRETLALGAPVVMVQELQFPHAAQERVRKELASLNLDYAVYLETGTARVGEKRVSRNSWAVDHGKAVATFLHREAFNVTKTRRRAWCQQAQRELSLIHI